ncbi:MAG: acyl carrier protein [Flexilinea sp.]
MENIYDILQSIRAESDFRTSNDFIGDGLLDSFDIITLVSELEDKFTILIDALDIIPENFCSVDSIIKMITKSGGQV